MNLSTGDYVTYPGDGGGTSYGRIKSIDEDTDMAKVEHHDKADDGSLNPTGKHDMKPTKHLTRIDKPEKKAVLVPLSDDGDPFKVGDLVTFDGWSNGLGGSIQTGGAYLGIIRAISGNDATIEYLDTKMQPRGDTCIQPLPSLREYMLPGSPDEEKRARIEFITPEKSTSGIEYKSIGGLEPQSINGRTIDGIAAVMGNIDDNSDVTWNGAFRKTIREQKGRVMFTFNHELMETPRARIDEIKEIGRDELPTEIKSQYPQTTGGLFVRRTYLDTPRGNEAFAGVVAGAIREMSYGFKALKKDWSKYQGETVRNLREVRLIDICDTTLGVNAATMARKSALPFHETPKAAEDEAWDGPAEIAKADVNDLKAMCAWVDSENAENKSAYKLPHHQAGGDHAVVWAGVRAAMSALLGGRGGVDIPASDKKAVYNHLAKHYAQFDKEPPDFKMVEIAASVETARGLLASGVDFKAGRMISAANEAKIKEVIDAIETQLESLEDLLGTAEPPADEGSEQKALTDAKAMLALLDLELISVQIE